MLQKWNSLDEGCHLTLSKEAELRPGEDDCTEDTVDAKPEKDTELELLALDTDEPDGRSEQIEEILDKQLGISSQKDQLLNGTAVENGHPVQQQPKDPVKQKRQS